MLGALKGVMKSRGLGMNVKVLYEKVGVPTVKSAKNRRFTAFYCFTSATGTTGTGSYRPFF